MTSSSTSISPVQGNFKLELKGPLFGWPQKPKEEESFKLFDNDFKLKFNPLFKFFPHEDRYFKSQLLGTPPLMMTSDDFMDLVGARLELVGITGTERDKFMEKFEALYLQLTRGPLSKKGLRICQFFIDKCTGIANEEESRDIIKDIIDAAITDYHLAEPKHKEIAMSLVVHKAMEKALILQSQVGMLGGGLDYGIKGGFKLFNADQLLR